MTDYISILDNNKTFTPLVFYTDFLEKLSKHYLYKSNESIGFKLFENGDDKIYGSKYRIDPISIPLLLSILEQLSKFHNTSLPLLLYNNRSTSEVLEFLYRCGFFNNLENEIASSFPRKSIIDFDDRYLGAFKGKEVRKDHIIRSYDKNSLKFSFNTSTSTYQEEVELRDKILSTISYKVRDHYSSLLFDNEYTLNSHNLYIDILSELITNGVLHSGSTTYAMMFVDRYKCKFSISDNGIGLKQSLNDKKDNSFYYKKGDFASSIKLHKYLFNDKLIENLISIFETLYYSSLKERRGLFDLMLNVVLLGNGYFRLHTDNCQVIISNRIFKYLENLFVLRENIFKTHNLFELRKLEREEYQVRTKDYVNEIKELLVNLLENTIEYYSEESKYSAIRFYNVKFRGVHIEVEIPNV